MPVTKSLVGKWKPATDGERLFHFLATNVAEFHGLKHLAHDDIYGIMRGRELANFVQGVFVLHCFARLLQVAKHYRVKELDNPEKAVSEINYFVMETLGIAKSTCKSFRDLAPLAIEAAAAASKSSKTPSLTVKKEVLAKCHNLFYCYSCGSELDPQAESHIFDSETGEQILNSRYLEFEHLWPHSYGGNSIPENLLPACYLCNREKQNIVSWEWVQLQAFFPNFESGAYDLDGVEFSKIMKIGLHIRAALDYAKINGATLKDSYKLIGPRLNTVSVLQKKDTADFFNLRVHDPETTGIYWG